MADAPCEGSLATSMKCLDEIFANFWRKLAVRQEQREEREWGDRSLRSSPPATHRPATHATSTPRTLTQPTPGHLQEPKSNQNPAPLPRAENSKGEPPGAHLAPPVDEASRASRHCTAPSQRRSCMQPDRQEPEPDSSMGKTTQQDQAH
ncbi:Hypothetical predicted protein [Pelobates cultripes]|uniref:Uncharacterized protein n=1 Tax=Pelobates cultripes TaxID=61616 RepID=A0AAD1QXB7_PELCU|nr:Hypothetical predicted protein [Pelobates cultripes]